MCQKSVDHDCEQCEKYFLSEVFCLPDLTYVFEHVGLGFRRLGVRL